jgi:hypothetical protein
MTKEKEVKKEKVTSKNGEVVKDEAYFEKLEQEKDKK